MYLYMYMYKYTPPPPPFFCSTLFYPVYSTQALALVSVSGGSIWEVVALGGTYRRKEDFFLPGMPCTYIIIRSSSTTDMYLCGGGPVGRWVGGGKGSVP